MSKIRKQDALDYHSSGKPGKIEVVPIGGNTNRVKGTFQTDKTKSILMSLKHMNKIKTIIRKIEATDIFLITAFGLYLTLLISNLLKIVSIFFRNFLYVFIWIRNNTHDECSNLYS